MNFHIVATAMVFLGGIAITCVALLGPRADEHSRNIAPILTRIGAGLSLLGCAMIVENAMGESRASVVLQVVARLLATALFVDAFLRLFRLKKPLTSQAGDDGAV